MANDSRRVPSGRLRRLAHVAAIGPRAGIAMAHDVVDRATGGEPGEHLGELLYATLGQLKGGALKAGQMFAQVSDALPEAARVRLGRLFSSAPTLAWPAVAAVIEAELGAPPDTLFAEIERVPFAGASLGQVHRARLPDGTSVAVKVQYPGVAEALEHDLDLLQGTIGTVSGGGLLFDVDAYFTALRDDTLAELDYRREAAWLTRMAAATAAWPDLVVPALFDAFSAERVLTCALLEGDLLHQRFDRPGTQDEADRLGLRVVRAVAGPLFAAHLINADAHPGNFVVLPDDRLGLLDFGATSEVDAWLVEALAALVPALVEPDDHDLTARLAAVGIRMRHPDTAVLAELAELIAMPLRGTRAFADDDTLRRIGQFKQRHPVAMLRLTFDPGLLPVMRALVGVLHALKQLRVNADLGATLLELCRQ